MAEGLLRDALRGQEDIIVESAGLGALVDHPASDFAVELMSERGVDIASHRARQLHPDMVSAADLILVMELVHKKGIDEVDQAARGKVHRLGQWRDMDISDPYGQSKAVYAEALKNIEDSVADWVERLVRDGLQQ